MFGVANGAYVIRRDLQNLGSVLADFLGPDPMAPHRAQARVDYLGDLPAENYASAFIDASRRAATEPLESQLPRPAALAPLTTTQARSRKGLRPWLGRTRRELLALWKSDQRLWVQLGSTAVATAALTLALAGISVWAVLALGVIALVVASAGALRYLQHRRNWRLLLVRSTPARALLGLAAVVALIGHGQWWLPVTVLAVLLSASVATERMIESMSSAPVPAVRNLPNVRRVVARPDRGLLWAASCVAVLVGLIATILPGGAWIAAALAIGVAALTAPVCIGAIRRADAAEHADNRWRAKLRKYAPQYAVFVGTPVEPAAALSAWLPYLKQINRRFVVITHYPNSIEPIQRALRRHGLRAPIVQRPKFRTVERSVTPSLTTVFYANNALFNTHMVFRRELNHVWLNHLWGDGVEAYSPMAAMYDKVFVPGQAAIDRFSRNGVRIPASKFRIVGRPQADAIKVATGPVSEMVRPTILYAPTWFKPGGNRHSSLRDGVRIVETLLATGARIVFRPNRLYARYAQTRDLVKAVYALLEADRTQTGREHLWGPAAEKNLTLTGCLNTSDVLVCDGPGTLYDYLRSQKPYIVISDGSTQEQLVERTPLLAAAYIVHRDLGNLGAALSEARGADSLAPVRQRVRADHFGDFPDQDYAQVFIRAAREIIDGGRPSAQAPKKPVDDDAGSSGHPSVVGQQVRSLAGPVAQQLGHAGKLPGVAGQRVGPPAPNQHDLVADPAGQHPGGLQVTGVVPIDHTCSRSRPAAPRSCGRTAGWAMAWACCSCSSCTVHSTSAIPPGPSFSVLCRIGPTRQPLGLHPRLELADLAAAGRRSGRRRASAAGRSRPAAG